jgi:hypothetical protein
MYLVHPLVFSISTDLGIVRQMFGSSKKLKNHSQNQADKMPRNNTSSVMGL